MQMWIVIEGTDGSGKNTVAEWIRDRYEACGQTVRIYVHPSERLSGKLMKTCLQGEGIKYFLSVIFFIIDLLLSIANMKKSAAEVVIFVRYSMSAAYLPPKLVKPGYTFLTKLFPQPDHQLFVDVDPATAMERIHLRNEEWEMFETEESIADIRKKMLAVAAGWDKVDNSGELSATFTQLQEIMEKWLIPCRS